MALVKEDAVQRVEVHDGWIDVRAAITVQQLMDMAGDDNLAVLANPNGPVLLRILTAVIVAWSYDDPPTPENIRLLDMDAMTSVIGYVQGNMGVDQKKGLNNGRVSRAVSGRKI